MPNLESLPTSVAEQVRSRVDTWESGVDEFLNRYDEYARAFKLDTPDKKSNTTGFTRTRVAETTRATMALATSMYRMATVSDPIFEIASLDGLPQMVEQERLHKTSVLLRWQHLRLKYLKKLFRAYQGVSLFGTQIAEEPWTVLQNGAEGTDFIPISLLQFAFDPSVPDISLSDFHTKIDYVTPNRLRLLSKSDPNTWDQKAVEEAIELSGSDNNIPERVRTRRERAGYSKGLPVLELSTQYGPLDDYETEDGIEPVVSIVNGMKPVRAHSNPFPGGRPFRIGHYLDFELEPYGLGVGQLGRLTQKQLDGNRNRLSDLITMSLLNMWLVSRASGINSGSFKIKPNGIIEGDDISEQALKPWRPLIEASQYGIQLDRILKDEFMGATGATPNLLGLTTDATATETSIAQNEGIRRISVPAEILADEFIREHLHQMHRNNHQWLDREIWASVAGMAPTPVNRRTMVLDAEFFVKVATDKDFRPNRIAQLQSLVAIVTSVRNKIPQELDVVPFINEIARAYGINPARIWKAVEEQPQPNLQEMLLARMKAAQGQAASAPEVTPEPGEPMPPMEIGPENLERTPVGLVGLTP